MNRSKTYIGIAAAFAALAASAHFTAKPLWAEVKAALIQNVDEPARNPFSEDFVISQQTRGCTPDQCDLVGKVVPAGKRLVITNITGQAYVLSGSGVFAQLATVEPSGESTEYVWLPATVVSLGIPGVADNAINFNLQLQSYYEAGQTFGLFLSPTGGQFFAPDGHIRVSGYYVNL